MFTGLKNLLIEQKIEWRTGKDVFVLGCNREDIGEKLVRACSGKDLDVFYEEVIIEDDGSSDTSTRAYNFYSGD
jgi:hypothetical protein